MRFFVTGVCGQLGHDVMNELLHRGYDCFGSDVMASYTGIAGETTDFTEKYIQLDITDKEQVDRVIVSVLPDVIIHCAAWTAVDLAEEKSRQRDVRNVNVDGTKYIAHCCARINCAMLYISTDYVFSGKGDNPWEPDEQELYPLNYYGQTKLDGEKVINESLSSFYIVRTSWAFGIKGNNFVKTMIRLGEKEKKIRVVNDQIGTPTYTSDLARLLVDMVCSKKYGYYHVTNEGGYISWADFAKEIFSIAKMNVEVIPVTTSEYGLSKAIRPKNSRLSKNKLAQSGFEPLPTWQDALKRYLITIGYGKNL